MSKRTPREVVARLKAAGISDETIAAVVIPDWWDDECYADPMLSYEIEFPGARLLGCSMADIRDPSVDLSTRIGSAFKPWSVATMLELRRSTDEPSP